MESRERSRPPNNNNKNDLVIRNGFPALLRKDGDGPLIDGEEPIPKMPFASFQDVLKVNQRELLERDCVTVFTARTRDDDAAYSAGCTYFVPAVMKPRCALEALALQIFQAHVKDLDGMYVPEQSGAEWWTLVMDAAPPIIDEDDDDEDGGDEVGLHFDADYGLEEQASGLMLHPRLATVTYLSDFGAPTLVLNRKSPPPGDIGALNGPIANGWLSSPKYGKHIAFDGRLLHGAPATFFPGSELAHGSSNNSTKEDGGEPAAKRAKTESETEQQTASAVRVTFLVNVWLNHCPIDAEPLEDDALEQLKTPWELLGGNGKTDASYVEPFQWTTLLEPEDKLAQVSLRVDKEDPAGTEETVICDHEVVLSYNENMKVQHQVSKGLENGKSAELKFEGDALVLQVGGKSKDEGEEE